jgi:hypothetical protein
MSVRYRTDIKKALGYAVKFGLHDAPDDIIILDEKRWGAGGHRLG